MPFSKQAFPGCSQAVPEMVLTKMGISGIRISGIIAVSAFSSEGIEVKNYYYDC